MFGGFQRGVFVRWGIPIIGVVRAPGAIINFAFFMRELLVESYMNSEILTGISREVQYCSCARATPTIEVPPPLTKNTFGNP